MKKKAILFAIILMLCGLKTWAQRGLFLGSDKLSSTHVTSICQDLSGYIWIATEGGLNRFDGYKFTLYRNQPQDSTSLMFNIVNKVFCDRDGHLWVGTNTGLQRYDATHDNFQTYESPAFQRARINDICQMPDGRILVGTASHGLFQAHADTRMLTPLKKYQADSKDLVFGHMWTDAEGGLWKDGSKDFSFIRPKQQPLVFTAQHDPPMAFAQADGAVLVMNRHKLLAYDKGTFREDYFDTSDVETQNLHFWTAMRDHLGNIYIGTRGNGLYWIPRHSRKLQRYKTSAPGINMNTSTVETLFEDREGNIWVACWQKGLLVIPCRKSQFSSWSFSGQKHDIGNYVSSLCKGDKGMTWCVVRNEGVYGFDAGGQIVAHPSSPAWTEFIYRDGQGRYYVGAGTEVYAYTPQDGSMTRLLDFPCNMMNTMADDGHGHLFFSAFGRGMLRYDLRSGQVTHFTQEGAEPSAASAPGTGRGRLCNDWILYMTADRQGNIWLATTNGVCCYDDTHDAFVRFPHDRNASMPSSPHGHTLLEGKRCESLCETAEGDMLIGTMEGLYVWRNSTGQMEEFPHAERLRGLDICYIVQDRSGDIWCSTSMGIWHYRSPDGPWISHVSGSGLISKEYTSHSGLYLPQEDRIFFATSDGITTFTPEQVQGTPPVTGSVHLTHMSFGGKSVGTHDSRKDISLPYSDQLISMEFSLMNFLEAANTVFEYRLRDQADWVSGREGQNTFTFTHLPIGTYRLEVRALVNGEVSPSSVFSLTIESPWYRSTLAYIIYIVVLWLLLAWAWRVWRQRLRLHWAQEKMRFMLKSNHNLRMYQRHHILLVEDDIEKANHIIGELNLKYKFDYAPNGKEALKLLLSRTYDLVVSAEVMPVMNGIDMLKCIKGNSAISEIPVILLSSREEPDYKLLGLKSGADACLSKSCSLDELQIQIDNLIDNVQRLRGKFSGALQQEERIEDVQVKGNNEALMERIMQSVNAHLSDSSYTIDVMAADVGLSRAQLHRKMKEMTGIASGRFLRNLRMEQAARLLREGKVNVSQIADKVGYIDQAHFSTAFKTHFGVSPSEYVKGGPEVPEVPDISEASDVLG